MSDSNSGTDLSAELTKITANLESMFSGHKDATSSEISKARQELTDLLAEVRRSHDSAVKDLDDKIKEIRQWVDAEEKSRKETGKPGSNSSTLVVPPQDVNPPQAPPPTDTTPHNDEDGSRSKRRFRWY